ncbi:MAG: condensation domain-containing protein, partial [Candidatus Binatia bacterium]
MNTADSLAQLCDRGGSLPMLDLPTDNPRPAAPAFRGARQSFALPITLTEALKGLSRHEEATLFMTLLAAFKALLYRYTGQEDIVVGAPAADRSRVEIEGLDSHLAHTLPLRTNLSGNPTFRQLLARVREEVLRAYAHQDRLFDTLEEARGPQEDPNDNPLFQVMFGFHNGPTEVPELSGGPSRAARVDAGLALDWNLFITEREEGLQGEVIYNADLFSAATIGRMLGHFQTLLEGIVDNPEQRLARLPFLTAPERQQLLVEWNRTTIAYPKDQCIHQLLEAQVERTPDAVVVVFEDKQLTYRELNCRANQLAHHLRTLGVGPEVLVGLCMERSPEMVVGLLGILKAGGAYVPLDPD